MELHPTYCREFPISDDPFIFAHVAQAVLAGAGAIEELGLKVSAGPNRPSMVEPGKCNPEVLEDLQQSMRKAGIDPNHEVTWLDTFQIAVHAWHSKALQNTVKRCMTGNMVVTRTEADGAELGWCGCLTTSQSYRAK
jgi:hypothetical protein